MTYQADSPRNDSWLALLTSEAEPSAYDECADRLLAQAEDEPTRQRVREDLERAKRLLSQQTSERRKVRDLEALYDVAVELGGILDREALLQRLVTRSRRLLAADIAYMALLDQDDAETMTIRVTDGALGDHLRGIRISPHAGVAGKVADRGEPVQSLDYLSDDGLVHWTHADRSAQDENLRTILGVPLRLRGTIIGVLLVASREMRRFEASDVNLLSSLASFAAIAVENARLVSDYRAVVAEVHAANALLRVNLDDAEKAALLHDRLLNVAARGSGLEEVIATLSEVLSGWVGFLDDQGEPGIVATNGERVTGGDPSLLPATLRARTGTSGDRRTLVTPDLVSVPVATAGSFFGSLRWCAPQQATPAGVAMLERGAVTIALVLTAERAVTEADRRTSSELLERVIEGGSEDDTITRRLHSRGLDITVPHSVVVLDPGRSGRVSLGSVKRALAPLGGLVGRARGRIVGIVPAEPQVLIERVTPHLDVVAGGVSGPVVGLTELQRAHDEAAACAQVMEALGAGGRAVTPAELGPYRSLLTNTGRGDARRFVDSTVGALLRHDRERHTDLAATAETFLRSGSRHALAAEQLHIHPNTLYQRLDRITSVLGADWREPDRAFDIHLALRLERLMARLKPDVAESH
jgi:hypothetical protein